MTRVVTAVTPATPCRRYLSRPGANRPKREPGGELLTRILTGAVRSAFRSHALWLLVGYVGLLLLMAQAYV